MSASKKLILNLTSSHVVAGVVDASGGQLVLEEFITHELDYDQSKEEAWLPAAIAGIRAVKPGLKASGDAIIVVPGSHLLTKAIRVSSVESSRQEDAIGYEVQQNIPHQLSEVEWGRHQVADDGVEASLLVSVIKASDAKEISDGVAGTGFPPVSIQPSTVLDYNAYRYLNPGGGEDAVLINIGARTTNLIFITDEDVFVRTLNYGGNTLTQSLSDGLGLSFAKAEEVKTRFFGGKTSFDADDEAGKPLKQGADSFTRKLSRDLTLSVTTYKRQNSSFSPQALYLTGRGSLLPGLADTLSGKLKVEAKMLDVSDAIQMSGTASVSTDDEKAQLIDIIGAACAETTEGAASINLLPAELAKELAFNKKKPILIAAAACLAIAGLLPMLKLQGSAAQYKSAASEYAAMVKPLSALSGQIADSMDEALVLKDRIVRVEGLANTRPNWINFIIDLQGMLDEVQDVWLDELEVVRDSSVEGQAFKLRLAGRMVDFQNPDKQASPEVNQRVNKLLNSFPRSAFIQSVEDKRFDTSEKGVLKFRFTLILNPEKPL